MDRSDCVVIGAGVIGLSVGRALARAGHETLIIDSAVSFGTETSSRNSEVIHAGIYYEKTSLKARTCIRGRHLLYSYSQHHGIPHRRCGKLIVATHSSQRAELEAIMRRAQENGVEDLELIGHAYAKRLEPAVECVAAILSPSSGVIDSHSLMVALLGDAEHAGACLALMSEVERIELDIDGATIYVRGERDPTLQSRWVVNCAGLRAPALAARMTGFPTDRIPRPFYAKGSYFTLSGRCPFGRLIYPVPEPGGLGVHLTLDMADRARFGPDVEWIDQPEYTVDPARAEGFAAAIRRYWPALSKDALAPGYAGVRPKISGPNQPAADFVIEGPSDHGVAGIVQLFGIESPGLTASLAIAELVASIVSGR